MGLFQRNINGHDVLSVRSHIQSRGPISRTDIIKRYYPGDPTDPTEDNKRKNLNDVLKFLEETNQVNVDETDKDEFGFNSRYETYESERLAILHGLNQTEGEDRAYIETLEMLAETDERFFDISGNLLDEMSTRRSDVAWNDTRTRYWTSMMEVLGLVKNINSNTDSTSYVSIHNELFEELLEKLLEPGTPEELRQFLERVDKNYFPVFTGTGNTTVAAYVIDAIEGAKRRGLVEIDQVSDFGQKVEIDGRGVNSIERSGDSI